MSRLQTLLEFLEQDPTDAFTRFAVASEYLKMGDSEAALSYFEGLVDDNPRYVGTYYHLGSLYVQMGRPDDAEQTYRAGIKMASELRDHHARAELQDALMNLQGMGWDDD